MNDRVNGRVLGEDIVERCLIVDVDLVEVRATATDELNAIKGHFGGVVKIVDDDNIVAMLEEGQRGERANVASSTATS